MFMRIMKFDEFRVSRGRGIPESVVASAGTIVNEVRLRGDDALLEFTDKFDGVRLGAADLRVGQKELKGAYESIPSRLRIALEQSAERIRSFQELQLPEALAMETAPGVTVGVAFDPLESAGIYVPGGKAEYPSTVLMTAIPAKVAGIRRIVIFTPPGKGGKIPEAIMAAAYLAGADEVYRAGGAQAIAAMAYGTKTVRRVEKIVGPGNIYVQAAKMLVSRDVAVDMPAGPSEVLIYAEERGREEWIAADMLAQAEHDPEARAMLITPDNDLASEVEGIVEDRASRAPRREILEKSMLESMIVVVKNREEGIEAINEAAPEHLQLMGRCCDDVLKGVRNAGAVFLGDYFTVALGDYSAGTNHVLPTMGWARRASPLSVRDFLRSREFVRCSKEGIGAIGGDAVVIGKAEGLLNHARSVELRMMEVEAKGEGGKKNERK